MQTQDSPTERAALGRIARIGELYDARTDSFIGANIISQNLIENDISQIDNPSSKIEFETTNNLTNRFKQLDVNAELQLSVLANLVQLNGSGKYLKYDKTSSKSSQITLLYSISTKSENLNLFNDSLKERLNFQLLNTLHATHIVVGIDWGANCAVTAEARSENEDDKLKVEGALKTTIDKIGMAIKGEGEVEHDDNYEKQSQSFTYHSNLDVVSTEEPLPTSLTQVIDYIKKLPKLISNSNNGKGKPISYKLLPIDSLRKYYNLEKQIDSIVKSIDENTILKFVYLFEHLDRLKQKVVDIYDIVQSNSTIITDVEYNQVCEFKNQMMIEETELRKKLGGTLIDVRSGKTEMISLEQIIQDFETSKNSTTNIEKQILELDELTNKISYVNDLQSKGVIYVRKKDSIEQLISEDNENSYVFFSKWSSKNEEKWKKNNFIFKNTLKTKNKDNKTKFLLVDSDIKTEYISISPVLKHYFNGQVFIEDVLQKSIESSDLSLCSSTNIENCLYPPNNRVAIKIPCPGSFNGGKCESSKHYWHCDTCKSQVEYGFDNYFYCECGKSLATNYHFKCNSKFHGNGFIFYPEKVLKEYLQQHRPLDEMNILLLGETGVGKSTWINSFANYIHYDTLDDAKDGEFISIIPSNFVMTDDDYNEILIETGTDKNEHFISGQSATQEPRTYSLRSGSKIIRLIDTPGIGDTRGLEIDKKNMSNILSFLSNYDEIHGICILLKPNNARIHAMFRFCIKELLTHLHKDAAKNIIFCFTNGRSTFYRPGDSLTPLKTLLKENNDVEIALSKHTMYTMDNESFRFLAAIKKSNVTFTEKDFADFSQSWERSTDEIARMLNHIETLMPHRTKNTLSLNDARRLIVNLTKPIADISQNIQTNIRVLEDKKEEIENSEKSIEELAENLYIPAIKINRRDLDYPRTVCTSDSCVDFISIEGTNESQKHYKTHCHEHCHLTGISTDIINNPELRGCAAMNSEGYCTECGCHWTKHMHIEYETYQVLEKVIDKATEGKIKSKKDAQRKILAHIKELQERVDKLKREQEKITLASAKFACFLKQNAITPYNDALASYLEHLISEEEQKVNIGGKNETLEGLKKMKKEYDEQVKVLESAMGDGNKENKITLDDIKKLEKELLSMEISGDDLKNIIEGSEVAKSNNRNYKEYQIPQPKNRIKLKNAPQKLYNEGVKLIKNAQNSLGKFIN